MTLIESLPRAQTELRNRLITQVSVTGIDGSGKDTVTKEALRDIAVQRRVVKLGRPAYEFTTQGERQIFGQTTRSFDRLHQLADRRHSPRMITLANAVNVIAQARILEPLVSRADPAPDLVASSRDPRVDPAVYLSYYSPKRAARLSYAERVARLQRLTHVHRDVIIRLTVDPGLAVERITDRIRSEAILREASEGAATMRDKWQHIHENVTDLTMLQEGYDHALTALRNQVPTAVVEIDTNERSQTEVAKLTREVMTSAMAGQLDSADWYRL